DYALAGLFVLLSYLCGFAALEAGDRRWWVAYAVALALCLYTDYTTVFVLFPQILFLAVVGNKGMRRNLLLSWAGAVLAFIPWMGVLAIDAAGIAGGYWIPPPTLHDVSNTVLEFAGILTPCPSTPCTGHAISLPGLAGHALQAASLFTMVVAVLTLGTLRKGSWPARILALWLILPFVVILLLAVRRSLYLDRVFLDATFALYLLVAAAVVQRQSRGLRVLGGAMFLVIAGAGSANLPSIYAGGYNPDWRSAARDFATAYRAGQAVLFYPGVLRSLVGSYLPSGWHARRVVALWSRDYVDVPGWGNRFHFSLAPSKTRRRRDEALLRTLQLARVAAGERQVWLVTYDYDGVNDVRRWFTVRGFEPILSETYRGDTRIELWDRSPIAGPSGRGGPFYRPVVVEGFGSWGFRGAVARIGAAVRVQGNTTLSRSFAVQSGGMYSISVEFRGDPPAAKPLVTVEVRDAANHLLGIFPRTQWYDWPVNGVWLSQPFGFVAPPGAAHATLTLRQGWGSGAWRHVAVYQER
ncbi:MAG: hypothetical protein ACR2GA_06460, partial [Chloroflexota bacterium]